MEPYNLSARQRPIAVAAVVPDWLQTALAVLLKSEPQISLVACTASVQALLLLSFSRVPDVVLLDTSDDDHKALDELSKVMTAWPQARCVALVKNARLGALVENAGARLSLIKGVTSARILQAIDTAIQNPCSPSSPNPASK